MDKVIVPTAVPGELYIYRATVVRVYDGDTITVDVDLGFHVTVRMNVRLARINAPELRGATKQAGQASRDYLSSILPRDVLLRTYKDGSEKYGRFLADVFVDGTFCVNDDMVAKGYAVWGPEY